MVAFAQKELRAARILIILAGIVISARWLMWAFETEVPWWGRAIAGAAIGALMLAGLPALWKWSRERAIAEGHQTSQSDVSSQASLAGKPNIPITIKRAHNINQYDWQPHPFGDKPSPENLFAVGPLYISNNSARALTLDVAMGLVDTVGGPEWKYPATGLSLMGLKLGRDDLESRFVTDRVPFLLSPLTIESGKTLYGRLGFLRPGDGGHQVEWKPTLIITDVATDVVVRIPIGGQYFGTTDGLGNAPAPARAATLEATDHSKISADKLNLQGFTGTFARADNYPPSISAVLPSPPTTRPRFAGQNRKTPYFLTPRGGRGKMTDMVMLA